MYVLVVMVYEALTRDVKVHRDTKRAAKEKKKVTLICFEHDQHRDAIMCNVPFLKFRGN